VNPRFEAAWEVHTFLAENRVPYAIIGGTALPRWGEPRFTKDVDLVVRVPVEGIEKFAQLMLRKFSSRVVDPISFARQTRMILIRASNQCEIDVSLGIPGYEDEVIQGAVDYELAPGKVVRFCSAEDLIIHKCVSGRPQDITDINGILIRQGQTLHIAHIRKWLRTFAEITGPEVLKRFERAWRAIHPPAQRKIRKFGPPRSRKQ